MASEVNSNAAVNRVFNLATQLEDFSKKISDGKVDLEGDSLGKDSSMTQKDQNHSVSVEAMNSAAFILLGSMESDGKQRETIKALFDPQVKLMNWGSHYDSTPLHVAIHFQFLEWMGIIKEKKHDLDDEEICQINVSIDALFLKNFSSIDTKNSIPNIKSFFDKLKTDKSLSSFFRENDKKIQAFFKICSLLQKYRYIFAVAEFKTSSSQIVFQDSFDFFIKVISVHGSAVFGCLKLCYLDKEFISSLNSEVMSYELLKFKTPTEKSVWNEFKETHKKYRDSIIEFGKDISKFEDLFNRKIKDIQKLKIISPEYVSIKTLMLLINLIKYLRNMNIHTLKILDIVNKKIAFDKMSIESLQLYRQLPLLHLL